MHVDSRTHDVHVLHRFELRHERRERRSNAGLRARGVGGVSTEGLGHVALRVVVHELVHTSAKLLQVLRLDGCHLVHKPGKLRGHTNIPHFNVTVIATVNNDNSIITEAALQHLPTRHLLHLGRDCTDFAVALLRELVHSCEQVADALVALLTERLRPLLQSHTRTRVCDKFAITFTAIAQDGRAVAHSEETTACVTSP
jgi:hypothetical protein